MSRQGRQTLYRLVESLCIFAAILAGLYGASDGLVFDTSTGGKLAAIVAAFLGAWHVISRRFGARAVSPRRNLAVAVRRSLEAWLVTCGLMGFLVITTVVPVGFNAWITLAVGAGGLAFLQLVSSVSQLVPGYTRVSTLVIGSCPSTRALTASQDAHDAFRYCGFLPFANEDPRQMPHLRCLGEIQDLAEVISTHEVRAAIVSPSDSAITGEVHRAIDTCESLGLQTHYFPSFLDSSDMRVGMAWSANRPGLSVQMLGEASVKAACKRAIDVVGSALGILALLPVFVLCAAAVKLTSKGSIFYRQTRVGAAGSTFSCFKFRTMYVGAHAQQAMLRAQSLQDGPAFKIKHDPRITPIGRVLRKFSLDELPQLFNVLLGDMSLVGPRPPIPSEVEEYSWWQRRRIAIKPGLTCIWQVYGRNSVSFKRWVEMDLYYIDNWSIWMDLKLIAQTFKVVLRGTGM